MNNKSKSILYTTSFLRSLFTIIVSFIALIIFISQLMRQENYYTKIKGEIKTSFLRWESEPYDITLNTSKRCYYTYTPKYFSILEEKAIVGKEAVIWYDKNHSIKKLVIEDEIVIPYYKGVGMKVFFILFASFLLIGNLIYIIKNPSHLRGKNP